MLKGWTSESSSQDDSAGDESPARLAVPSLSAAGGVANLDTIRTDLAPLAFQRPLEAGFSLGTLARGIWALIFSRYLASDGFLLASHFGGSPGWVEAIGVRIDSAETVHSWLKGFDQMMSEIECRGSQTPSPSLADGKVAESGVFVVEDDDEVRSVEALSEPLGLTLRLFVRPGAGCLEWRFNRNAFRTDTILTLARCVGVVLGSLASSWRAPVGELPLLTDDEEQRIRCDWNRTQAAFADQTCIHQFFEDQAARTPESIAVAFRDVKWSYRELNTKANVLAAHLRACGIVPGARVAVALHRSPELLAALLAVLKAGGAYVPLDPAYPSQRLGFMLEDAHPAVVVASRRTAEAIPKTLCPLIRVEDINAEVASPGAERAGVTSSDPAYVIYTSGSTGKPKGVIVTHRNVANFFDAMDAIIGPEPGVWLAVTSVSFDISVFELFWTLARGFRVVIQEEGQLTSASGPEFSLARQIRQHAVTHLQCTPSLASMLARDPESLAALRPLRRLMVGGEALSLDLARKLAAAISGDLLNMYGPTETTIWSTACLIKREVDRVLIGRPIANTQLYVLDSLRRIVPAGFPGELYIGGVGVAAGYLNRPDVTAERFVSNPFSNDGDRLYRTGDIVRYEPDGAVEFLGRADQQIKIRGFRIELGEIELVLRQHPQVRDAAVIVREDVNNGNDKRLVAYVIANSPSVADGWEIRTWLRAQLPDAMVPSAVMLLESFPQTPNGKLDRGALPLPKMNPDPGLEPPANELELAIASIWAEVLGVQSVSVTRGFFDVGGHSLLMTEVHDLIQDRMGIEVPLIELFHHPTVRSLADHFARKSSIEPAASGNTRGQLRQQSMMRRAAIRRGGSAGQ